jgi:hypothetical protein
MGLSGRSHQPLLDACREIKSLLGPTAARAALFREGKTGWDISCSVEWGAAHTVGERSSGGIKFEKYQPVPGRRKGGRECLTPSPIRPSRSVDWDCDGPCDRATGSDHENEFTAAHTEQHNEQRHPSGNGWRWNPGHRITGRIR